MRIVGLLCSILAWLIGLFSIFLSLGLLFSGVTLLGIISLVGSLAIMIPDSFWKSRFKFQPKRWMRVSAAFLIIIVLIVGLNKVTNEESADSEESAASEAKMDTPKQIVQGASPKKDINVSTYSACDFFPDPELVPTQFIVGQQLGKNTTCSQNFHTTSFSPEVLNIKVTLYENPQQALDAYNQLVKEEKEKRGYSEISAYGDCFGIHRERAYYSFYYVYCHFGHLLLDEVAMDMDRNKVVFSSKIPKDVEKKSKVLEKMAAY